MNTEYLIITIVKEEKGIKAQFSSSEVGRRLKLKKIRKQEYKHVV